MTHNLELLRDLKKMTRAIEFTTTPMWDSLTCQMGPDVYWLVWMHVRELVRPGMDNLIQRSVVVHALNKTE
jgi:hypothetical protein